MQDLIIGHPAPHRNPNLPNEHERKHILTVAMILTHGMTGIVNVVDIAGNTHFNVLVGINHHCRREGWPSLQLEFVRTVLDSMSW